MGSKDNQLAIRDIPTILKTSLDWVGSTLDRVGYIFIKVFFDRNVLVLVSHTNRLMCQ